uniref:EF-hand domain-containing protein n=1 Tax=Tetraselmis chuii TaxID=63592 RepID=A0A7S1T5A7_9CHLO|mmetsp:Transcript_5794/g.10413  ORF Transcript_5794/g.10413 Transcript_5794/m.10413 type:complete len:347 (+) Transcript_5794:191-1231(+)
MVSNPAANQSSLRPIAVTSADVELNDMARRNSACLTVCTPAGNSTPGFNYAVAAGKRTRMSQKVVDRLEKIDANGDGRISADELVGAIEKLIDEEKKHRDYKSIACAVIALLLFVLLANLGLAFAVVFLSKELDVKGATLVSIDSGLPVQVDSASFVAQDGALRGRGDLDTGLPLETAAQPFVHEINTTYSDDYLAEVLSIRLSWPTGASAVLGVKAFSRPGDGNGSALASQLTVMTSVGFLTIHADRIKIDQDVENFLLSTGVMNATGSGKEPPSAGLRRRLLQGVNIFEIETFGQFMGHTTAVCEVQATQRSAILGTTYEEEVAICQQRALVRRSRSGGFVIED